MRYYDLITINKLVTYAEMMVNRGQSEDIILFEEDKIRFSKTLIEIKDILNKERDKEITNLLKQVLSLGERIDGDYIDFKKKENIKEYLYDTRMAVEIFYESAKILEKLEVLIEKDSLSDLKNIKVFSGRSLKKYDIPKPDYEQVLTKCASSIKKSRIEIRRDGPYIWFGEYPQTIATSKAVATMGTTPDSKGYYTSSYDNERYAKVVATPTPLSYTFSDSTTVKRSSTYYFKVEPIKWRILSESDRKALILCESIIANERYNRYYSGAIEGVYANNYAESEVRAWLNDQFYNIAFSELQKSLIQTTEVDNSVYSTGYDLNPYTCENTFDKIFLPSYIEVMNRTYGFRNITDRYKVTSDYSRATGTGDYTSTGDSYSGNDRWWLRSPYDGDPNFACSISSDGNVNWIYLVDDDSCGLVPALTISLD